MTEPTSPGLAYDPLGDGVTMGASFVAGGAVPVGPSLIPGTTAGLVPSVPLTVATLFVMGVVKARLAGEHWLRGGAEITGLAGAAALLAYVVGTVLPSALGITPPAG